MAAPGGRGGCDGGSGGSSEGAGPRLEHGTLSWLAGEQADEAPCAVPSAHESLWEKTMPSQQTQHPVDGQPAVSTPVIPSTTFPEDADTLVVASTRSPGASGAPSLPTAHGSAGGRGGDGDMAVPGGSGGGDGRGDGCRRIEHGTLSWLVGAQPADPEH